MPLQLPAIGILSAAQQPWSAQVPRTADPGRRAHLTEIAALMDARKDRLGEHAAGHQLPWAAAAPGPVPAHPPARLDWQNKAAAIGAVRELSGYAHPADPIGPEPAAAAPDVRAARYEALAAPGPAGGPDARGLPDGRLLHLRDTYPLETAWAPRYVGDELRQVRAAAWNARLAALRASAEAKAASSRGQHDTAARHQDLAGSYHALHQTCRHRETVFAAMADPAARDAATRAQRHLAVAADAELRRRHPGQRFTPAPFGRTTARHPGPARRAHPDPRTAPPGAGPADHRPGRRPPGVRRHARRTAEPDDPRPRIPATETSARRSRPGQDRPRTPSCSRPGPRSAHARRCSNAPQTGTPTGRPQIDSGRVHPGNQEVTAMTAIAITGMGLTGVLRITWDQFEALLQQRPGDFAPAS